MRLNSSPTSPMMPSLGSTITLDQKLIVIIQNLIFTRFCFVEAQSQILSLTSKIGWTSSFFPKSHIFNQICKIQAIFKAVEICKLQSFWHIYSYILHLVIVFLTFSYSILIFFDIVTLLFYIHSYSYTNSFRPI